MRRSLGALMLAAALIAGCGSQPATPSPSATVVASVPVTTSTPAPTLASTLSPAPTPTLTGTPPPPSMAPPTPSPTSPLPGTAALVLPPGTVRTIDLAQPPSGSSFWSFPAKPGGPPTGPYVYLGADPETPFAYGLSVADLGGGSVRDDGGRGRYLVDGLDSSPALLASLTGWCAARGLLIAELRTTGATLEERYLALTDGDPAEPIESVDG